MRRVIFIMIYVSCFTPPLHAQSDFYKGKQIKVVVGASAGAASDLYARVVAHHLPKQIPGKPDIIVQNMPGGGSITAANYVYSVAKPDGLTLGAVTAPIYFAQLLGRKEVQFDWGKFTWIGTPEENDELLFIRSDQPYKTLLDLRRAHEPPRCGASGVGSTGFYIPKLLEEIFSLKINMVTGYPGAADVDVAVEKNEVHCRGTTISAFFGREPGRTWAKNGFVRFLVQTGDRRNHRLPNTPTIWELMEQEKVTEPNKRLARVVLGPGAFGRPILATPGIPSDRVKMLRDAYNQMLKDPEFLADANKRQWEINPISGEKLEALAKEVINQPPEIIERMKKVMGE
ncbi:MAG TPA: tripartite tricarboxylate transporter substrate-binding protein [Candidatus Binatia bacterium]|jgi:tripartite-type tricarboxylate transporter receptor subunit TctC|nr:tripartite tricarboxylate transporter substrate-binding protein [Candidatus Binatia bacterium]